MPVVRWIAYYFFPVILFVSYGITVHAQVWQQWMREYNGQADQMDDATAVVAGNDGCIYVTGWYYDAQTLLDWATFKYNATGQELWMARYQGISWDKALALSVDGSGSVVVTGYTCPVSFNSDFTTIKYNANGVQQWVTTYNGTGNSIDEAIDNTIDVQGNVYITGRSTGLGTNQDAVTIKYDALGNQLWIAVYDGPTSGEDETYSVAVDESGNVYVVGRSQGVGTDLDYLTIKYNHEGVEQWVRRYNGPANGYDVARALDLDPNGEVLVTGWSAGVGSGDDFATLKYTPDGQLAWETRYNGPGEGDDQTRAIVVDSQGNSYVTGYCDSAPGPDTNMNFATAKYSPTGNELWVAYYNGPHHGPDRGRALALDEQGNVFVSGSSTGLNSGLDFTTLKYSPDGAQLWEIRHSDPENLNDEVEAIALDLSGQVYVIGTTAYGTDQADFATLKYAPIPPSATVIGLSPANPPIIIPASGGSFDYTSTISNSASATSSVTAWIMARTPNQLWYGPVAGPISLVLPGGTTLTRVRAQTIPANASAGIYTYEGRIGGYPDSLISFDSFNFTKVGINESNSGIEEWLTPNEPFQISESSLYLKPTDLNLLGVTPNPFNSSATISYQLAAEGRVNLQIFDIGGRSVEIVVNEWQPAGKHVAVWNGSSFPSGIYLFSLTAAGSQITGKMALVK
jgi:uncharacterized delta-60 repeat protein